MKKRLISMLLTVLMVASLFGGMSVSAYADDEYKTTEYTLKSGDTLLKVCNNLGLNWYSCQTAINKLNNISEAQYRKLGVGQVIKLPATNEDAAKIVKATISNGTGSTGTGTGGVISGGTGSASGVNAAYWLIPYTMQKGETVAGVCNVLGISFATYSEQIKTINNISKWSKVAAGKTLLLPSASAPAAGTSCYAVVAHQIQKGETTYSICNEYGISYNANSSLMQTLNKGTSLSSIKYGRTLYVPVPTVVSSGSTGGSGTVIGGGNSNNGSNNSNNGNNGNTKTYTLSSGTVKNGKISFTVNGKTVTSAAAGSTVTIKPSPDSGCGLKSVSLKYADGSAVPKVTDSTFTMPACNVVVNATFEKGYYMGPISAHGSVTLYNANSVATTTAAAGAEITVKVSPSAGYLVEKIWIQKNNGTGAVVKDNMKSGDSFTMPDCPVFVRVEYRESAVYTLKKGSGTLNGSFVLKVNGSEVTKAAAGTTVEVVCSPASGYAAKDADITIVNEAYGTESHPTEGKFIMPSSNVTVKVAFNKGSEEEYALIAREATEGTVSFKVGGSSVTKAKAGETVTVEGLLKTAYTSYKLSGYTVKSSYGEQNYSAGDSFIMPASDVTVTPVFQNPNSTVTISNDASKGTVTVTAAGQELENGATVAPGTEITVTATPKEGYAAEVLINGSSSNTHTAGTSEAIKVEVKYTVKEFTLTVEEFWVGHFNLEINGVKKEVTADNRTFALAYGTTVKIVSDTYALEGYTLNNGATKTDPSFTMPAENTSLHVYLKEVAAAASLSLDAPGDLALPS